MSILTTDKQFVSACATQYMRRIQAKIKMDSRRTIQTLFNKASFDFEAMAAIKIAKELGYDDLAEEMQSDFDSQINSQEAA